MGAYAGEPSWLGVARSLWPAVRHTRTDIAMKNTTSFCNPSIDIMRYLHRTTITITPRAMRQKRESAASGPGALSHTYTCLQTHSSIFDIANCRLMDAAAARVCWCVSVYVQMYSLQNQRIFTNANSTINILIHSCNAQI